MSEVGGGDTTDGPLNRPVFIGVVCVIFGLWILGCCLSSRCCGMWGRLSREERDLRLAQLLQNEVLRQVMTPQAREFAARERERKAKARREFVEQILPRERYRKEEEEVVHDGERQQCTICLTDYKDGECIARATTEVCPHIYHRECIADWLLRKKFCPVCREVFLLEDVGSKIDADSEDEEEVDPMQAVSNEERADADQIDESGEMTISIEQTRRPVDAIVDEEQAEETVHPNADDQIFSSGDQGNQFTRNESVISSGDQAERV